MTDSDRLRERAALPTPPDDELARLLAQDAAEAEEYWRQRAYTTFLLGRNGKLPERPEMWEQIRKEIDSGQAPRTAPRRRMRLRAGSREGFPLLPVGIAAAILMGVIVLAAVFSSGNDRPARRNTVQASPPPLPPPEPEPLPRVEPERPKPAVSGVEPPPPIEIPPPKPLEAPRPPEPKPPTPPPAPPREEPKPPPEKPAPVKPTEATVIAATLLRVEGEVTPALKAGDTIAAGQGLTTGEGRSAAVLAFTDGTRIELEAETAVRDLFETPGKRLFLERGTVTADVTRQKPGQTMIFRTPDAEARVLGTSLKLIVPAAGPTRLEVKEGRVRLTRLSDGKWVDVAAGQFAAAVPGADFAARPLVPKPPPVLFAETFEDARAFEARWRRVGVVKAAGRLEIDLSPRPGAADGKGWMGGGIQLKQAIAAPFAVNVDVEIPELHAAIVTSVTFVPPGQQRGSDDVFRVQLRDARYALFTESGEARELAGADRAGGKSCKERWRVEIDGPQVTFMVDGKEVFKHRHGLRAAPGYSIDLDGSARADAPASARSFFDSLTIEKLRP